MNEKDKAIAQAMASIQNRLRHVYNQGFEDGRKAERKTGKWVLAYPLQENDGGAYVCSCCKSGSYEVIPKTWKACPWCTALMEVDECGTERCGKQ